MEVFRRAKMVRLKSCHHKYLTAEEDEESVVQDRRGFAKSAKWTVEFVEDVDGNSNGRNVIRLKSCYGKYLTASNQAFLLGMTGRKVVQSAPKRVDQAAVEWEPVTEKGGAVKLKARLHGRFLRANWGLPPWRNSVTHDIPHRTATQEWIVWEVEVMDILPAPLGTDTVESLDDEVASPREKKNKSDSSFITGQLEPNDHSLSREARGNDGRIIYFHKATENWEIDQGFEELCITFKGNGIQELTRRLEEELGVHGITVCARSPLDKKLYPLHLQLPPNNATMHLIAVPPSSLLPNGIEDGIHQKALHETAKAIPTH